MVDFFVQRSDGTLASYSGMDQSTVTTLLTDLGLTGTFLTLAQYQVALAAIPKPLPPPDLTPLLTTLSAAFTTDAKVTALIALLKAKGLI